MPRLQGMARIETGGGGLRPAFTPSPEQAAVLQWVNTGVGSAIVEAVAGSGKTTLLVEVCKRAKGSILFTAYNKKIADTIAQKLQTEGVTGVKAATFHAVGFAAWRDIAPNVQVDGDKLDNICGELDVPFHLRSFVKKLVSIGKQGMISLWPDATEWSPIVDHHDLDEALGEADDDSILSNRRTAGMDWATKVLDKSNELRYTVIDFDDMIYLPLMYEGRFQQFDWVLVDEAQDTNRSRREMARRLLRPKGRLIAVGDRHQAIYGFTGADADSLDYIALDFSATYLPLTVTYRCPRKVVEHAQRWVSHIQAHPSAPLGDLEYTSRGEFLRRVPEPTDAVLCRNTRPLVELAFIYLKKKIGCHVEGRDIGQGLLSLLRKWKSPRNVGELRDKLEEYYVKERLKLLASKKHQKLQQLEDKVETIFALMSHVGEDERIIELETVINSLFKDTTGKEKPTITLSTVHKAKGREWETVYLLGRDEYMPSKYAKQEWQLQQESNLIYVAVTRAKAKLVEVFTSEFEDQPQPPSGGALLIPAQIIEVEPHYDLTEVLTSAPVVEFQISPENSAKLDQMLEAFIQVMARDLSTPAEYVASHVYDYLADRLYP